MLTFASYACCLCFQYSCFSKDSFLLADYLYSPLATSRKSHFEIQSLSSCSFLRCGPTEAIHLFFIFCPEIPGMPTLGW